MKKIALVFMLLALVACTGGKSYILPPEGEQIAEVSVTSKCTFIKNSFAKGMAGSNLTRNIQLTTYNVGGDSYKIISTSNEMKGTVNITVAEFQVWKCKQE